MKAPQLIAALCVGVVWMFVASPTGDLFGHWTDHLRHQGEAVALVGRGLAIYGGTYDQAMASVPPPCPQHLGLWGNVGIPYPPAALLLHLPLALAERSGLLAPAVSHRAQVLLALLAGLGAALVAFRRARGERVTQAWVLLWFGPLVAGAGACGMYDAFYVLAAVLAVDGAWHWRAVSCALHVRGLFALAFGRLVRPASPWSYAVLVCAVAPTVAVAIAVATHAAGFPLDNRLNVLSKGWLLVLLSAGALLALHRFGGRALMLPLTAATALLLVDPQTAFWHLLPAALVPLSATVPRRAQLTAMAWAVVVSFLYLVSPWPAPVFWLTVR